MPGGCNCNKQNKPHSRKTNKRPKKINSKVRYGKPHHKYRVNRSFRRTNNQLRNNQLRRSRQEKYNPNRDPKFQNYVSLTKDDLKSWDHIHKKAVKAVTTEQKEEFERYMNYLIYTFPCGRCRPHIKEYLSSHPIKSYYNIRENGKDIGMARWSWEFHNDVNRRTNKAVVSWLSFSKNYF